MVSKVKICSTVYKVHKQNTIIEDGNEVRFGDASFGNQSIRIATRYPYSKQLHTLLHEIFHGITDEYQIEVDEKTLSVLSNAVYALIVDNKQMIRDILENK